VLIKLESQGPAFIRQPRAGRLEEPFRIFKFRSMREVSEADEQAMASLTRKVRSAYRTTRFGRLLRRTSLDELPQLLNVFLGHMSLVGPRPLVFGDLGDPYQIASAEGELEPGALERWRQARSQVRPGMTGLWQVSGRSSLPLEGWLQHDVEYVERCSLGLDLQLLWRTAVVVLKGTGAN
jgi:lipopolysaccharide/colanic/teichoic acid biosynthesis glycosyltransferase